MHTYYTFFSDLVLTVKNVDSRDHTMSTILERAQRRMSVRYEDW